MITKETIEAEFNKKDSFEKLLNEFEYDLVSNPDPFPKQNSVDLYSGSPKLDSRNVFIW